MRNCYFYSIFTLVVLCTLSTANAGQVGTIKSFASNTPAIAAEVNSNFSEHTKQINDNDTRIIALEETVVTLLNRITTLENKLANVSNEIVNGQPTVRFSRVNLQVVNGLGATASHNGTGNIIIGYDEENTAPGSETCSVGTDTVNSTPITNEGECIAVNGTWALSNKTGSHYLVTGRQNNYTRFGGLLSGQTNTANYDFSSIVGGFNNIASGFASSVSGGTGNVANGNSSNVSGGTGNIASGNSSSISGGQTNRASNQDSSVCGGRSNEASGIYSSVSGGQFNTAGGENSSVSGGNSRSAMNVDDWAAGALTQDF